jgi:hypothetical protein
MRDLIALQLKKKELQNQVILNSNLSECDRTIVPVKAFKQILTILGLKVPDNVSCLLIYDVVGTFQVLS